jgi:OHCU decarboxylase
MNALDRLNSLSAPEALSEFLKVCGSKTWAQRMVDQRPFVEVSRLLSKADDIWASLAAQDWLEAFRSHPKIGEKKAEQAQSAEARAWSEQEQAGTRDSAQETMQALAAGNREFEQRFGYIFIVCATGKTSVEMLANLRERVNNDPDVELRIAAEEQRKITQLRLKRLLES